MSDSRDQIDRAVATCRRIRVPSLAALLVSIPIGVIALRWNLDRPSDERGLVAGAAGWLIVSLALLVWLSWYGSDRARYLRYARWSRRISMSAYHDPSTTRMCPRCGLPMDRVMGGAFYTGKPSPKELCHRCLHSDDLPGPDIPDE